MLHWLALWLAPALANEVAPGWSLETWTTEDGLPLDYLNELTVDRDGVLWIASYDGLVRFDGVTFDVLRSDHPLGPTSNRLSSIIRHPVDGAIWVRDQSQRLQRRDGDEITTFDAPELAAHTLLHSGDDALWTLLAGGMGRLGTEPEIVLPEIIPGTHVLGGVGGAWVVTENQLRFFDSATGALQVLPDARLDDGFTLRLAHDDLSLSYDHAGGLSAWDEASEGYVPAQPMLFWTEPPTPSRWGYRSGRFYHDGEPVFSTPERVQGFQAYAGQAWVTTEPGGLARVRPAAVTTHRGPSGQQTSAHRLWWDARQQTLWAQSLQDGWWALAGQPERALPPLPESEILGGACSPGESRYFEDHEENVWIACTHYVSMWDGAWRPAIRVPLAGGFAVLRTEGTTWLGGHDQTLVLRDGTWQVLEPDHGRIRQVLAALQLPDGGVLLGGARGLWRAEPGSDQVSLLGTGEPLGAVRHLRLEDGLLWISTVDRGLCMAKPTPESLEELRCLGSSSGLERGTIHASLADDLGRTWVSSNQGIGVIATDALRDYAAGGPEPAALWLGTDDGMLSAEANGFFGDAAARTPDGRLWFVTQDGVVAINPDALTLPAPPEVLIHTVRVGEEERWAPASLDLEQLHPPLKLRWSTAAIPWAEQVRFRYRVGPEQPWSELGTARTLELVSLPPGAIPLELQARLGGGWGPSTTLTITRAPAFSERAFFPLLLGLLAVGGLASGLGGWAAYQRRVNRWLSQQVDEQTQVLASQNDQLQASNDVQTRLNNELAINIHQLEASNHQIAVQAEQLEALDDLKRQFIANISHELRTPLSLILAPLGGLRQQLPEGSKEARHLSIAYENAERLEALISQLFDLSRAQAGGLALRARRSALRRALTDLLLRFEPLAEQRGVVLALEAPAEVELWVDPDCLDKVMTNLLSNALRFSPEGSTITVRLDADGEWAHVAVEDEGPGVPAEYREAIFERFVQVDSDPDEVRGGGGLGLSLVGELVELHGGEVALEDGAIGARFVVSLPMGVAHLAPDDIDFSESSVAAPELPAELPADVGVSDGARVLLVEDHPQLRAYLAEVLGERFHVTTAVNGAEGLERLQAEDFALLISDITMPEMDGHELVRRLRALPEGGDIPVLFISARQELSDRVEGLELADDYLPKPFQAPELVARAAALLRRRPAAPEGEPAAEALTEAQHFEVRLAEVADPRLSETAFNAGRLSKAMAMSPRTLQLRMKQLELPTPASWLRTLRLERGRELIASRAVETVGEAAAAVGMSPSYFSRAFTAHTGASPSEALAR